LLSFPVDEIKFAELPCGDYSSSFQPRRATSSLICQHFNLVGSEFGQHVVRH